MNTKKIAKLLADTLRQIANEIEPQPEPAFKVRDWVEYKGKQYRISAFGGGDMMFFENAIFALTPPYPVRKLDPSEVIVDFGSGIKGTIKRYHGEQVRVYDKDGINFASIAISFLDASTRSLVESLLKAQEEQ